MECDKICADSTVFFRFKQYFRFKQDRIREPSQITFDFLAFDHVRTPPSLHILCSKFSIFLTTYPPLNANVICEGSLSTFQNTFA